MNLYPLPVYPDLYTVDAEKLAEIEAKCRKAGHLNDTENLLERIAVDKLALDSLGVTREDIYTTHCNMKLVFDRVDEFDQYSAGQTEHCKELLENLPGGFGNGWCQRSTTTNEIVIGGQHLRISRYIWGGAEQCPIEKSFSKKYYGYERGDRDWFVTNLVNKLQIWVPDLLPAQIGMFGFAHSPNDPYRVDPVQYCKVFGVSKGVQFVTYNRIPQWDNGTGPSSMDHITRNYDISEDVDTPCYHMMIAKRKESEDVTPTLFIHFHDREWLDANKDGQIIIKNLNLDVRNIFNYRDYTEFHIRDNIVLDVRDDSEAIHKKIASGPPQCVIQ